jgi:hypothetical protein
MSSYTLSQTQLDQLRQMYLEHGSEPVFLDFGEIVKQNGNPKKQPKKQTKKQMKENKKLEQAARAEEWAAKIKTKHDIDIAEPTEYTFTALKKIHRTGEMQEKRKKRTTTPFMRFLAKERIENRTVANPIPSKEITKLTGQKWQLLSDKQKAAWKVAEIQKPEEDTVEPVAEIQKPEEDTEETDEEQVEAPKKATKAPKKATKAPKKAKKAAKMKKPELVAHLTETHGWGAKLLSKFIVSELHQAMETGELPTEAMEKRKSKKKTEKKTKDTVSEEKVAVDEVVSTAEQEAEPETPGMFEMSDSDSDSDSESEGEDEDE